MNRQIKFRVWDNKSKQLHYLGQLLYCPDLGFTDQHGLACDNSVLDLGSDLIIQQFTGLADKSGKEIYEGDIIRITQEYSTTHHIDNDYKKPTYQKHQKQIDFGVVVFDVINDIDDFYSPYVLGWGIKSKTGTVSSLYQKIQDFSSYSEQVLKSISNAHITWIKREFEFVGNICENEDLLK